MLAEQVCDLLEKMQGMNGHDFTREVETVLAQLEDLRAESLCDEQSHVLWQQLSMISRLLLPAYQSLAWGGTGGIGNYATACLIKAAIFWLAPDGLG